MTGKIRAGGGKINRGRIQFSHTYDDIISLDNLLEAWKEFVRGKRKRIDVQVFERNLMANIISLHHDLATKKYSHSKYSAFRICDPKPRDIHKARVRDRLLHHALHRRLAPFFAKTFIYDSHSCQIGKGTHRAIKRLGQFIRLASRNNTQTEWVLKCDIKKFFANIDHGVLIAILEKYIPDKNVIWLLSVIIGSFNSGMAGVGLPLGNLTSQLFVNIYMNEFDQFVKHRMKERYYIRYADDFIVLSQNRFHVESILPIVRTFLQFELKLSMHPNKIFFKTVSSGIDFLGWVHFPNHRVLRTKTKRRMFKRIRTACAKTQTVRSYLGLLDHGNGWKIKRQVIKLAGM